MSWLSFLERQRTGNPVRGVSAAFSPPALPTGYEHISGRVTWMSAKTRYCVHLRISGFDQLVELRCTEYWAIKRDDVLDLLGQPNLDSGKFIAKAYYNRSQRILDARHVSLDCKLGPSLGFLDLLMAGLPVCVSALFFIMKIYVALIFLLPFTAVWLAFSLLFWKRWSRGPSWAGKEPEAAWIKALAAFRQNVGGVP